MSPSGDAAWPWPKHITPNPSARRLRASRALRCNRPALPISIRCLCDGTIPSNADRSQPRSIHFVALKRLRRQGVSQPIYPLQSTSTLTGINASRAHVRPGNGNVAQLDQFCGIQYWQLGLGSQRIVSFQLSAAPKVNHQDAFHKQCPLKRAENPWRNIQIEYVGGRKR